MTEDSAKNLVGSWRLVSFVAADPDGTYRPVWGDRPSGLIFYAADGVMAAQLYDPRRSPVGRLASASPLAETQPSYVGLITYFGTYSVDFDSSTVSHSVQGAMAPDWVGVTLVRRFRFLGPDRIELSVAPDPSGRPRGGQSVLVWERVRP